MNELGANRAESVLVTGGTGFIGKSLVQHLLRSGYECWVLSRQSGGGSGSVEGAHYVQWLRELPEELPSLVINLSGENIAEHRWTPHRKIRLRNSRVALTLALVDHYRKSAQAPRRVISGSAVGYYGSHENELLNEEARCHPGFSHELCQQWEEAAQSFESLGASLCRLRIGVVIGAGGGVVARMHRPFQLGLGGVIGSGEQWISWIHRQDLINLILFLLEHETLQGPLNATSPNPVTNAQFTRVFAKLLHRPALFPLPAVVVRSLFGQMGEELLLSGQRVIPERLVRSGFEYVYPELSSALAEALGVQG